MWSRTQDHIRFMTEELFNVQTPFSTSATLLFGQGPPPPFSSRSIFTPTLASTKSEIWKFNIARPGPTGISEANAGFHFPGSVTRAQIKPLGKSRNPQNNLFCNTYDASGPTLKILERFSTASVVEKIFRCQLIVGNRRWLFASTLQLWYSSFPEFPLLSLPPKPWIS